MPRLSGLQVIRALQRLGFTVARQRGSHVVMKRVTPQGKVGCVVPRHKELAEGTLRNILRQAAVSMEQLKEVL